MKNRYIGISLFIVFFAGASELAAQMGTGRVAGTIEDTEGNPIDGASVVAEMAGSDFTLDTTSDERGRWAMIGFRAGEYSFTFTAKGFVPQQFTARVQGLGKNPSIDVVLEPVDAGNVYAGGPAGELLNEGNVLFEQKDYQGALAKFEEILREAPELYQVRQNIGNCYMEMGDFDKALAEYQIVLEEEPTHTGALVRAGDLMVRKGDLDQAVVYFERAIEGAPEDEVLPFNVAEIYFGQGDVAKAIEYYERSSAVRPEWPEPYLKIGYAYLNLAQMDKAAESFRKVVEVAPETPQAQMAQAALDSLQQ
jgi:tetratricopeptide (TPR) repeat protein